MKKIFVLALALVFVLSGAVMAEDPVYTETGDIFGDDDFLSDTDSDNLWNTYYGDLNDDGDGDHYDNHVNDDGVIKYSDVNDDVNDTTTYINLPFDNTLDYGQVRLDGDEFNQSVAVKLDVDAYIPCFIEMKLVGNRGTSTVISYTDDDGGVIEEPSYFVRFDNEIGGFLNSDWETLGHGSHAEVNPGHNGEDIFIGACDYFTVEVVSNAKYQYQVISDKLTNSDSSRSIFMDMQTSYDAGSTWPQLVRFNQPKSPVLATRNPGVKLEALHRFRVPYNMETHPGEYTGDITFKAATI